MEQFLDKNESEPKQKSQVFRLQENKWVDPSSSSSSDYSSDTEPNYK